ncbi:acetyltransferase [Sphingomonas sp. 37zxx]|uniref:acetyltransferase n=1 Tax=Sphingomonas sp. 37zxx TaxID=1550073 RepID=UPI00053BFACF|nr:acetyltransferase [Sphingomonas sp. 37zxx]
MVIETIHLIGAGGHGRVVADALVAAGVDTATIVVRDGRAGLTMLARPVATPEIDAIMAGQRFHVAIGLGTIRARLHMAALAVGARPFRVVHPSAIIAPDAVLGDGLLVAAGAVIATGATIGHGTIINHGAVVDHDCRVGAFCHIAPNAALGGAIRVGDRVMIGAGAVLLPGITIADDVTIGAGAVVLYPIGEQGTWVGNPARRLTT